MNGKQQFNNVSPEDQKILDWMIPNRQASGEIGWQLKDGPEAVEWLRYYQFKYPKKAAYLKSRIMQGESYLVPCQWPQWFDSSFAPSNPPKESKIKEDNRFDRMMMSEFERNKIIEKALGEF